MVKSPGVLVLVNDANATLWSSNPSATSRNPIVQLLESGNLVVRDKNDANPKNLIWQSFDYLTDTLLPGMKLGKNLLTGREWYLSSWKNEDDPSPGDYTFHLESAGYPHNAIKKGAEVKFRSGPWNGVTFSGATSLTQNPTFRYYLVSNANEVFYGYEMLDHSIVSRVTLSQIGLFQRWTWTDKKNGWDIYFSVPKDICDSYSLCGAYGRCNTVNNPACRCLDKFVPKIQNNWNKADWSNGCVRRTPLDCKSDGFSIYSGVKLPDPNNTWFNKSMSLEECKLVCLRNCSCVAYANLDVREAGSGCLIWLSDLVNIRDQAGGGQEIYVRMALPDSDLSVPQSGSQKEKEKVVKIVLPLLVGIVFIGLTITLYASRQKKNLLPEREEEHLGQEAEKINAPERHDEDLELPVFALSTLTNATNQFSINNKLGEGGFGPVYKGMLEDGQDIAVKRLSLTSIQGLDEFKNEVICISKLQHRNLVKLLGCCIQGDEKMLIYEYMPNKSLDHFIFDEKRSTLLDWPERFKIINGIARGLLYLHQDSRLRIIHRDLKARNILLDLAMNPKISDFGIARSFGGNETEANTERVVGTYGYMSPEYAIDGIFSIKSDAFSFGVLVLEIVSGKKNRGFFHQDHHHNLLGHAWMLHNDGRSSELMDAALYDSYSEAEMLRSIQVALLCVQQSPEDRPSMSTVILMLSSEGELPKPKQPGFFAERHMFEADFSSSSKPQSSSNEVTITRLEAR